MWKIRRIWMAANGELAGYRPQYLDKLKGADYLI